MIRTLPFRLLCLLGIFVFLSACKEETPPPAQPRGPQVTVARPLVQPVEEWTDFTGRFESTNSIDVRSRVTGYLKQVFFREGGIVREGDPLFQIDQAPFETAYAEKLANLRQAESQVEAARREYERTQKLHESGAVSAQVAETAKAAYDSVKAGVASAGAAAATAKLDLTYARITAPLAGRIGRKMVAEGNLVTAGQDVLTTIVSLDPIHFSFDVDEQTYLKYARTMAGKGAEGDAKGMPVAVALADEKTYNHPGTIDFVDNALDNSTGTIRARAILANPTMFLTPGMFGRVRIRTGGQDNGILIPDAAIMLDQSRKYVYVVDENNITASRTIQTGALYKGMRIVTSGLTGQETVVVNGLPRIRQAGQPVTPEMSTLSLQEDNSVTPPGTDGAAPAAGAHP